MSLVLDGTNGLSEVDGSAATPAIRGTDTNTGIFFPAADTIAFAEGGVESARLDSSGNLGLGVTPSAWSSTFKAFQLGSQAALSSVADYTLLSANYWKNGSTDTFIGTGRATLYQQQVGVHSWLTSTASGTAGNAITFTQAMTLDASGNLLVGVTSAPNNQHRLVKDRNDGYAVEISNSTTGNPYGLIIVYPGRSGLSTANEMYLRCQDSTATRMYVMSNGGIANFSGNNANLSDRREKTNFAPAGDYLSKICAIPVQTYNYIDQDLEQDPGLTLGVVAQDVQEVAPELVTESNWGTAEEPKMRLSIYQTDLQYALMKCIQEQQALIDAQQAALQTLTARVTALDARLISLEGTQP
jgi:hypothetical protein